MVNERITKKIVAISMIIVLLLTGVNINIYGSENMKSETNSVNADASPLA